MIPHKLPKEPGFYWEVELRPHSWVDQSIRMVELRLEHGELKFINEGRSPRDVKYWKKRFAWYGPIPVPACVTHEAMLVQGRIKRRGY